MKSLKNYLTVGSILLSSLLFSTTSYAEPAPQEVNSDISQKVNKININTATAEALAKELNGVGLSKAKRIIEYREKYGPFVSIEQLKDVSGIGQAILDKNQGKITL